MGTPTLMLWADQRWPVGDVAFVPEMQRSWLDDHQLETYRTLSYGSPDLTPERLVDALLEVAR